ncbi:MAG TPA: hypothetical protein DCQ64_07635 [Candidatus Rokubacteria bacterium]|nr:hypothetical protein [Candidatus Rokubacteria bacterium]
MGLMKTRPSGEPMTLPAPLSTVQAWWRAQKARTTSMRSACTATTAHPSMRAISPGCGVRRRGPAAPASVSREPARAVSASASTTMGFPTSRISSRISDWVSGSRESPGPSATASLREASSRIRSLLLSDKLCADVSGSGSVMGSMPSAATMGCCEAGVAMVTSPAPLRRAARPASAAAPVFPTEPATTRRWP